METRLGSGASCASCDQKNPRKFVWNNWYIWACDVKCAHKARYAYLATISSDPRWGRLAKR